MKLRYIFLIIGGLLPLTMLAGGTQFDAILLVYFVLNPIAIVANIIFPAMGQGGCYNILKECTMNLVWNIIFSCLIYFVIGLLLERLFTKKPSKVELKTIVDTGKIKTETKSWSWSNIITLLLTTLIILIFAFSAYFIYLWAFAIGGA